jgi:LysM repeat protein
LLCTFSLLALLAAPAPRATAQDAATEERLRKLEKRLEDLQAENFKLAQDLREARAENQDLNRRFEALRLAAKSTAERAGNSEDIIKLAQQLKELDQRRVADQQKILSEVERMLKTAPAAAPPPPPTPSLGKSGTKSAPKPVEAETGSHAEHGELKGVWHTIEKDQTLGVIVKAYNDDLKAKGRTGKVTLKSIQDANPRANPNRLIVGSKLFIPVPEK